VALSLRRLNRRLRDRLVRLPLVEPRLERPPQFFTGNPDVEPGPPGLELDEAQILVSVAVASGVSLGLAQRTQPHGGTVLRAGDLVKNPQAGPPVPFAT
jgi:hypothetical protein